MTNSNDSISNEKIKKAIEIYDKMNMRARQYQKDHKNEVRLRNQISYNKTKSDPEKYEILKKQKRESAKKCRALRKQKEAENIDNNNVIIDAVI